MRNPLVKNLIPFAALASVLAITTATIAQDPEIQVEGIRSRAIVVGASDQGELGNIEIQAIDFSGDNLASGMSFSFDASSGPMFSSMSGSNGMMNMLENKSVRDEIELVDDQFKKMQEFNRELQSAMMKEVQNMMKPTKSADGKTNNKSIQLRGTKLKDLIKQQKEDAEKKLKDLLLPHQIKRLEQLSHQVSMKKSGTANALTSGKLKEQLELTDDEVAKLQARSKVLNAKLQQDIAALKAKAKKDLLKELSSSQRKKLDELTGDEFEYKEQTWRDRIKQIDTKTRKKAIQKK
ncbi:hypothetical protein OAF56_01720 [Pirellulaceae bacterium]|jgi:hypothetical protein|nr:hypothetical protein [Pirellulaceae bacterium]